MIHVKRILWGLLCWAIVIGGMELIVLLPKFWAAALCFVIAILITSYFFGGVITDCLIPHLKEKKEAQKRLEQHSQLPKYREKYVR